MVLCLLPPTLCPRSARATPLEYAVTKNASASPLECALPKSLDLKPPEMNSYQKSGGFPLSFRNLRLSIGVHQFICAYTKTIRQAAVPPERQSNNEDNSHAAGWRFGPQRDSSPDKHRRASE